MTGSQSRASGAADRLVAHRGFPEAYPENSLAGVQAALEAGARFVEFDVQLSRDRVPVVVHDATLRRVGAGLDNDEEIGTLDLETLSTRRIGEPERFGEAFRDERVASLAQMLALVDRYPGTTAFVEI
ncbi:MAG: glycerophosphodiester phosphodiesterase family protein [Wenzhouxiangellaceae bacterium]|nr:glycerophosphodiester phosphodiesterase family protein [Wenzhouxiangellaceae bacterium]